MEVWYVQDVTAEYFFQLLILRIVHISDPYFAFLYIYRSNIHSLEKGQKFVGHKDLLVLAFKFEHWLFYGW